jgi:hypothetical protein
MRYVALPLLIFSVPVTNISDVGYRASFNLKLTR